MRNLTARFALCLGALFLIGCSSTVADADPLIIGNATGSQSTATLTSYALSGNTLTFTVRNTSPHDARITAIGFDLAGAQRTGFSLVSTTADFSLTEDAGNVPQSNNANLDFALITGKQNFNGGKPNSGIATGTSATFTVSGNFANLTADQVINSIYVRFQRVGANGEGSDVGVLVPINPGTPNAPVPEPATMLLLGTGLAGAARVIRRRRARVAVEHQDTQS